MERSIMLVLGGLAMVAELAKEHVQEIAALNATQEEDVLSVPARAIANVVEIAHMMYHRS